MLLPVGCGLRGSASSDAASFAADLGDAFVFGRPFFGESPRATALPPPLAPASPAPPAAEAGRSRALRLLLLPGRSRDDRLEAWLGPPLLEPAEEEAPAEDALGGGCGGGAGIFGRMSLFDLIPVRFSLPRSTSIVIAGGVMS